MLKWLSQLDRILRGDVTREEELREGKLQVDTIGMAVIIVVLSMLYGACMGSYSLLKEVSPSVQDTSPRYMQLIASTVKVPALFYLTLLVTFPSLYVFNALVGSRLTVTSVLRLLVASLAVNLAVLASLGPIVLFFSVSTKSYAFVLLLNVVMFGVAGVLGLMFLRQTLNRLTTWRPRPEVPIQPATPAPTPNAPSEEVAQVAFDDVELSAIDMPPGHALGRHTRLVFGCWMVVFSLVGAQMGWVLRPFIGNPNLPFAWFRPRQSNFFEAVLNAIQLLLSGKG
jgi:hypothetical protein